MGYDVHITRAKTRFDSTDNPISEQEWIDYVNGDQTMSLRDGGGDGLCCDWYGQCVHGDGTWFEWRKGAIYTKNPDAAIIRKMIEMSEKLEASVQGDDCEIYQAASDQAEGFIVVPEALELKRKPWWRFW